MDTQQYNNGTTYFLRNDSALIVGDGVQTTWWLSKEGIIPRNIVGTFEQNEPDSGYPAWVSFAFELTDNSFLRIEPALPVGYKVLITFIGEKE